VGPAETLVDAAPEDPDVFTDDVLVVSLTSGTHTLAVVLDIGTAAAEAVVPFRGGTVAGDRRAGREPPRRGWGALVPVVVVPWLVREQRPEFGRLLVQEREHPGWWNRRLRSRGTRA
jgi:hypothetical protein